MTRPRPRCAARALVHALVLGAATAVATASEQLVLLTADDGSAVSTAVAETLAPALRELADDMGLEFVERDVRRGAPPEIHSVPAVVFADHRGRSVYQGRSTTLDRVRNFVQTARVFVQDSRARERTDLPVIRRGRMHIGTPIKLTPLGGQPPADHDHGAFAAMARDAITEGLPGYTRPASVSLGRTDRLFYVDFHPYRDAEGRLFLSTALFSQFHCHDPLRTRFGDPLDAPWEDRAALFARAAAELGAWIDEAIADATIGDGFVALDATVPAVTWDELGLSLPPAPADVTTVPADLAIPSSWRVDARANAERTAIRFRFPAPLDGYGGQARGLTGELRVDPGSIGSAAGSFDVDVTSVTMGEPDLDAYLQGAGMLASADHPTARFVLASADVPTDAALEFGAVVPFTMRGDFTMKGITIPVTVPAQLELTVGSDRRPRLVLQGAWRVDLLGSFGLEGPDGPDDVRHTLEYSCHIILESAG